MTEFKHTVGPWGWSPGFRLGDNKGDLYGRGGTTVLSSASYENMWLSAYVPEVDWANAILMEAAPDMLDALVLIRAALSKNEGSISAEGDMFKIADAAIANATRQPKN